MRTKHESEELVEIPGVVLENLDSIFRAYWTDAMRDYLKNGDAGLTHLGGKHVFHRFVEYFRWRRDRGWFDQPDTTSGVCPGCRTLDGRVFYEHKMEYFCHVHRVRWHCHGYHGPYPVPHYPDVFGELGIEVARAYREIAASRSTEGREES